MSKPATRASVAVALVFMTGAALAGCSRSGIFTYLAAEELIAVTPYATTAALNQTIQFTATAKPALTGAEYNWSLSPDVGTIDSTGKYTAPSAFPTNVSGSTLQITVTASLQGRLSTPGSATITLTQASTGPVVALIKVSGDDQSTTVATAFPKPIVVKAVDWHQTPVVGATIQLFPSWETTPAQTLQGTTGEDGQVSFMVTAPEKSGAVTLTAAVPDSDVHAVVFNATVLPGALEKLVASDSTTTGIVGTTIATPLSLEFEDKYGNPIPGRSANVTVPGGAVATPLTAHGDATGIQSFTIQLGLATGQQVFTFADSQEASISTTFTFTALASGPAALILVSGGSQSGTVGTQLSQPIVFKVVDAENQPVSGAVVALTTNPTAANGGGSPSQTTPTTDMNGLVSVTFTLGTLAGMDQLIANAGTITGSPLTVTETAVAGAATTLNIVSGSTQTTTAAGQAFGNPFVVEAADQYGNPVSGVTINFSATAGNGSVSPTTIATGANGQASTVMTAGVAGGTQTYQAASTGLTSVTLTLQATSTVVALVPVSGNGQTANPSTQLPDDLVVEALNSNGQPVQGAVITWTPPMGGSVGETTVTTGANGEASVTATLAGNTGTQTFTASAGSATATFTETAGEVVPTLELEIISGNNQSGTVGTALTQPLVVEIINTTTMAPVPGVTITWTSADGATVNGQASTGTNGQATATVTLGTKSGPEQVVADAGDITNSPVTFVATAKAGTISTLTLVTGDGQSTTVGALFGIAFGVEAEDSFGNPVTGATIDFAPASAGTANPTSVQTDAAGLAQSELTAGNSPGTEQFTASVPGTMLSVSVNETVTSQGTLHLAIISGNNQPGTAGAALAQPLVVEVTQDGGPLNGITVTFGVESGNGSVSPTTFTTGVTANGQASTTATLGSIAGAQTFSASIIDSDGSSPVFFTETASGGVVASLVVISGNGQTANPGDALAQPLVVEALDSNGQPIDGATITFTPPAGGGVSQTTVTTNAQGEAQVNGTLGTATGTQIFTASSGSATATFTETASNVTTGMILSIVSGSGQSGSAGDALGAPLVVEVTNQGGGPVSGVTINWAAPSGASITTTSATNGSGDAQATATLGTQVGTETFTASCTGCTNSPVSFTETVNPGPPTQIVIVSGDGQSGTKGTALSAPLVVEIEDANGNPVSGVTVTFAPGVGGGSVNPTSGPSGANGQVSVQATLGGQSGTDTFIATASVGSVTFTETATAQVTGISISPQDAHLNTGATQQYTATATYADGTKGDVTASASWSTSNGGVAGITTSGGLLTAVGAGTATVTVSYSGFTASTPVVVASATLVSIVLTPESPTIDVGSTLQFNAEGQYSNNTISNVTAACTWSSSTGAASVSAGLAKGLTAGQSVIECSINGVSASQTLTITTSPIVSLQITPAFETGAVGSGAQFQATATFQDGTVENVTDEAQWSSSDTSLMTLQNAPATAGFATLIATGTPDVIATYDGMTAQVQVTITSATVVSLVVTPTNATLSIQETRQLQAQATWSNGTVTTVTDQAVWSSSNSSVAGVSDAGGSSGLVTAEGAGTATITATFGGQSATATISVNGATAQVLRVYTNTPSIQPNSTRVTCDAGQTTDLQAGAILFGGGTNIQIQVLTTQAAWTTSNPTVAIVGNGATGGQVKCLTAGTTTITASFEGQSDSATVTVDAATLTGITISPVSATIPLGTFQDLNAVGTYSDGTQQTLTAVGTWSSANTSVATVSNASGTQGQVTGVAQGGPITVTFSYQGKTATASVTVSMATLSDVIITPTDPSIMFSNRGGNTVDFTATAIFSDNSTADVTAEATWTSSNPNVAVVTTQIVTQGIVVDVESTGSSQISATYSGVTGQTTLTSF